MGKSVCSGSDLDSEINRFYDEVFGKGVEVKSVEKHEFDGDFAEDEPDFEKDLRAQWAGFIRVGQGSVTNGAETGKKACGGYFGVDFCPHPELHNHTTLDGVNHAGKTSWVKRFRSCDKFSCPKCYKRAAQRKARHVAERVAVLKRQLGMKAQHFVWSCVVGDYALSFAKLQAKMRRDMKACGYIGGFEIFHLERFAKAWEAREKGVPEGWRISIHWHLIGFVEGGVDRCRGCCKGMNECLKCAGFHGRALRVHYGYVDGRGRKVAGDGAIIKVMAERKTIWGTAYYQMNHSTMRLGVRHENVGVWTGVAAKRQLKLKNEDRFHYSCWVCGSEMEHGRYVGLGFVDGGDSQLHEGECDWFDERGVPNFVFDTGNSFPSFTVKGAVYVNAVTGHVVSGGL